MKKMICILMMLLLTLPGLAEKNALGLYALTLPHEVQCEENEGSVAYVYGTSRVVAILIDRVPDAEPEEAVIRMMQQFDPKAVIGGEINTAEGFYAVQAVTEDRFGEGMDQLTVMVLNDEGQLLILSGYDLSGSTEHVQALLEAMMAGLTVHDQAVFIAEE